jgi:hypothetical protein
MHEIILKLLKQQTKGIFNFAAVKKSFGSKLKLEIIITCEFCRSKNEIFFLIFGVYLQARSN